MATDGVTPAAAAPKGSRALSTGHAFTKATTWLRDGAGEADGESGRLPAALEHRPGRRDGDGGDLAQIRRTESPAASRLDSSSSCPIASGRSAWKSAVISDLHGRRQTLAKNPNMARAAIIPAKPEARPDPTAASDTPARATTSPQRVPHRAVTISSRA